MVFDGRLIFLIPPRQGNHRKQDHLEKKENIFMRHLRTIFVLFVLLALTFGVTGVKHARAATGASIIVNTAADEDVNNAFCSLREAIIATNNNADYNGCSGTGTYGADIITFADNYTITLGGQLPNVADVLAITGNGSVNTTIQASSCNPVTLPDNCIPAAYRVFYVVNSGNLTLDGLTVRHGNVSSSGGGIYSAGTLTITNSTFSGNSAGFGGGGVFAYYILLKVTNGVFTGNFAGSGGGLNTFGSTTTITNSTFSGNYAMPSSSGYGGGIYIDGTLMLINSTLSGNFAKHGGGISNFDSDMTIMNSTIFGNSASTSGGGVHNDSGGVTLRNTIVAGSTSGGDCAGTISADGFNLTTDNTCGGAIQKTSAEINLGLLADNGGPTRTFALLSGSAGIDAGNDSVCADVNTVNNKDQRGVTRPVNVTGNTIAHCDIGAYEANPTQSGSHFIVNTITDTNDGSCDVLDGGIGNQDCTQREAINAANHHNGANTITFADNYTITIGSRLPEVTGVLTITGNGAANTIVQASVCNPVTRPGGCIPASYGIFSVGAGGNLTLENLTVQHGNATSGSVTGVPSTAGGGVYSLGTLTIIHSIFSGNKAYDGGGVYNTSPLTVTNSTFSGNSALTHGGGVHSTSPLTVMNSTFSGNRAYEFGGGVYSTGMVTISNSTFSENVVFSSALPGYGGGISANEVIIENSTFSNNSANSTTPLDKGGAVYTFYGHIKNSTFTGNLADNGGGIYIRESVLIMNSTFQNAGYDIFADPGLVTLENSIIAGSGCYEAVLSSIYANSFNLDTDGSCGNAVTKTLAEINLGALTDNGGPTQTLALLPGSAAIDAGDDAVCADINGPNNLDQRGVTRPQGAHCDIGAFEAEAYTLTVTSAHGTVTKLPDQATYHEGAVVELTAAPETGWSFANWTGDLTGTANPGSVTIHGNTSVTANYTSSNQAPTDIMLSNNKVAENMPSGALVGTLSTTDPNAGDTFTYSFACATLGADDNSFAIAGSDLNTAASFNFEVKKSYAICVRTTDLGGLFFDKNFTVTVMDVNEEMLKNGGFNLYSAGKKVPTSWVAALFSATDGKDTVNKKEGAASVKIAGATGKIKTLTQALTMSGPLGDTFTFLYWVKANQFPAAGLCQAQVLFYSGNTLKGTKTVKCPTGATYAWKQAKLSFTAPAAYTKVVLKFTFSKASGMVWFDLASLLR
jgi:CSLREA domain-containing protein